MKVDNYFDWIETNRAQLKLFLAPTIILMVAGVCTIVYMTGGIKFVFSHSMYLPISLAALVYGIKGGVLTAVVGGLLLGPFMPIDTITGEKQLTINWVYRIGFFTLIGSLVGAASDIVSVYLKRVKCSTTHDSVTGLPNTLALETFIKKGLPASGLKGGEAHFLMVARLENEAQIETSFGVQCIDGIIVQLADRIRNELHDPVDVYRIGSERLGFVQSLKAEHAVKSLAYRLKQVFTKPFEFGEVQLHANVYLGIVALEGVTETPQLWIQRACRAASDAGNNNGQGILTSIDDGSRIAENLQLMGELSEGLVSGDVSMHYQPKVIAATGLVYSVEALMRWQHPARGNIPPGSFIPSAENSTLIDEITCFAIDQSLSQLVAWENNGLQNMCVAVNISTKNLVNPDFCDYVLQRLEFHGLEGNRLELEVTESSFIEDMESSIKMLTKLTKAKISLSIDDFGTGYSSLQYLERMPISIIKIDQSFIRLLPREHGSMKIVEAAIGLAHNLDMKVIAEGVENRDAYNFLTDAGCDFIQGYFVGRPIPASELEQTYKSSEGRLVMVH